MREKNHYNEEEQYRQEEWKMSEPITEASYVYCPTCEEVHAGKCDFQTE